MSEIIGAGESNTVEFKSSLRMNLHTKNPDQKIEHAVLKTLAAFLNTHGGTLVVGVDDKGTPLGLENDGFQNEDKMDQHLANLIRDRLGPQHTLCLHPRSEDYEGKRILVVCEPSGGVTPSRIHPLAATVHWVPQRSGQVDGQRKPAAVDAADRFLRLPLRI